MKKIFSAAMLLVILFSCNSNKNSKSAVYKSESLNVMPATSTADEIPQSERQVSYADQPPEITDTSSSHPIPVQSPANIDWDKKIIKTASLKLEVSDFKKYNETVYTTVKQLGGYVAQEDQNLSAEKNETQITIKVPVYQFEAMMNALPGTDTKVVERKISTDDVTAKIIDTKSRLEAKKEMRQKYLEFLKQSKNMKEVLQVQAEINNIQEEMEAAAGQVGYLSHQSAMSTINLRFFQLLPGYKPETPGDPSFATRIAKAFKFGANALEDLVIGLLTIWPIMLILFAALIIWKRSKPHKLIPQVTDKNK